MFTWLLDHLEKILVWIGSAIWTVISTVFEYIFKAIFWLIFKYIYAVNYLFDTNHEVLGCLLAAPGVIFLYIFILRPILSIFSGATGSSSGNSTQRKESDYSRWARVRQDEKTRQQVRREMKPPRRRP